jgi:hypothetical protein
MKALGFHSWSSSLSEVDPVVEALFMAKISVARRTIGRIDHAAIQFESTAALRARPHHLRSLGEPKSIPLMLVQSPH